LEKTEQFSGWRQQKVAKIVQCGEKFLFNKIGKRPSAKVALSFYCEGSGFLNNFPETQV